MRVRVAVAGWSIPRIAAPRFPSGGSHLARYAAGLDGVEVNSSFYRPHRRATWERWATEVPPGFRFAVKVPRAITHEAALVDCTPELDAFLGEVRGLGRRLGPLLVQLPPRMEVDLEVTRRFLGALRDRFAGDVALEPRHPSWCRDEATRILVEARVARVAADPPAGGCVEPGGWDGLAYLRLHGSPRIYWSTYEDDRLAAIEATVRGLARSAPVWCVFDNTAAGAASLNALDLRARLARAGVRRGSSLATASDRRPP